MKTEYRLRHPKGRAIEVMFQNDLRWISTGAHDMMGAIRFAERYTEKSELLFREFADKFFSHDPHGYRLRNEKRNLVYDDKFYYNHQRRLENYLMPKFGDIPIRFIDDVLIEDWLLELKSKASGKELSDDSKNKILMAMREIMGTAKRSGIIPNNPAKEVKLINAINKKRLPFTLEELVQMFPRDEKELLHIWGTRSWAVYFLVMRDTGFRPGEVAALTRNSYMPEHRGIYSTQSVSTPNKKVKNSIKTTSKGQPYKVGILTTQTIEQLEKLLPTVDDMLFTVNGGPVYLDTANKHLRLSLARTKVPLLGRSQYGFRHAFETNLSGRVENKLLLELMGHTSYRPEYDHRTPGRILEQLQPMVELID